MKTTFTLLLATVLTTSAFAYDEGRLTVTVAAPQNAIVYVDGRAYEDNDNSVILNNIRSGNHTVKIYRKRAGNGNGRNGRNQREELLYSSNVFIRPSYHVDVVVNRFGKALVDERALDSRNPWNEDDENWNNNGGYGNNNGGWGNNSGYGNGNSNRALSEQDFNALHARLKNAWFSSTRLTQAKEAFTRDYFTTAQVRQVLQLFNTDSDKLELAKLAYRNTVDSRNYYQLNEVFSFQSSKEELDRYTRDFR